MHVHRSSLRFASIALLVLPVLAAAQPPALVKVDPVVDQPLSQTVPVIGRTVARQAGNVAARVNGPVAQFRVEVGDHIDRGEVIALLDHEMLEVDKKVAGGRLVEARARLATRQARVELARLERERLERLKQTQAAARSSFDDARQQEVIAQAEVGEASAAVTMAEAQLRLAEINLERAFIRAPYDGVVTRRLIEAGDYVQTGMAIVHMLSDLALEVEADVPFDRIAGLRPGTEVRLTLDDGSEHTAEVRAVIPEENRLTRTRTVRFVPRFNGTGTTIAAEQSVTVHVPIGAPRQVLSVHKDAITRQGPKSVVFVVEDGTAKVRPVDLGEPVGNRFEVVGGLQEGEQVVIRGNERLRPNQKVQVGGAPS